MNQNADKISDAEAQIMKVVWASDGPITYSQIRAMLTQQKGWESPTVNTLINRLVKKGVLAQEKKEVYYYTAVVSEEEYAQAKTKDFVRKVYDGNVRGLLTALADYADVTQEDLDELRAHLKKGGKGNE